MRYDPARLLQLCVGLLVVVLPPNLQAQERFQLQYRVAVGARVQHIYDMQAELVFVGLPVIPDSTRGEMSARVSQTSQMISASEGTLVVGLRYDSTRARQRLGSGAWTATPVPPGELAGMEVVYDPQMTPRPIPADTGDLALVRGLATVLQIPLPTEPIAPGDSWPAETKMPFTVFVPGDSTVLVTAMLGSPAIAVLDSLIARGADTLAYVTVRGSFRPRSVQTEVELAQVRVPGEFWGSFAGMIIWSTGWNTFVAGAVRSRVHLRLEGPQGAELPDARVTADVTSRFRVRL